jgi:glycosyltransferase involved in cell wall biosynthesis
MKIIFVLHSHKAGGAERHLLQLMNGLAACGIECIYAGPRDSWLAEQLTAAGFRCEHIPYHGIYDFASLFRLVRLIKRENADLVHGHLTRGAYYAGWAAKLAGIANVATAHSTNAGKHFGKANRIIAVSDAVSHFLKDCGYSAAKLSVVHHGVPDYSIQLRNSSDKGTSSSIKFENVPVISMVARLEKVKGHDIALRALAQIQNLEWKFVLAGATDTPWANEIKLLASKLGIAERIHFMGHVENVAKVYGETDIVLAPSRREALSLTLLEAASFGLPVIASSVGGISEAVENGVTGILVPSEDISALAAAIEYLLVNVEVRLAMGAKARSRYEELFCCETMTKRTISVYQEVIQGA